MKLDRRGAAIIGVLISALFLYFAFRGLNPGQFWENIQSVNPTLPLLGMLVYGVAVVIITWRWQFLLRSLASVPLHSLVPLVAIGYMGNNIYPFRSGEVLRIVLLRREHGVPYARAATTVAVERVFDGLVMLTFVLVPPAFLDIASPEVQQVATFTAPVFVTALAVFFVLALRPNLLRRLVTLITGMLPQRPRHIIEDIAEEVIGGLAGLRTPADLAGTVFASYATWAVEAAVYWITSWAFGLGVGYPVMLVVVGVVNLAGLIPASPGMIGVFEFFVSTVLVAVGVAPDVAVAYAVVVHLVIWIPPTLAGFVFLAQRGLGLGAVAKAEQLKQGGAA